MFLEVAYYRSEGAPQVYLYQDGRLSYQSAYPHGNPVIVVPPLYMPDFPPTPAQ